MFFIRHLLLLCFRFAFDEVVIFSFEMSPFMLLCPDGDFNYVNLTTVCTYAKRKKILCLGAGYRGANSGNYWTSSFLAVPPAIPPRAHLSTETLPRYFSENCVA